MKRKAFTLVELVAVLGCLSVTLGVAVVLLYQMFDLQIKSKEISEWTRSTNRFVEMFRSDVRRFGKPEIPVNAEQTLLRWQTDSTTVTYELRHGEFPGQQSIHRVEQIENRRQLENYRLSDDSQIRFILGTEKHEGLVALSLWMRTSKMSVPQVDAMNPFDRTFTIPADSTDVSFEGIWRTLLARSNHAVQGEKQ
jgi:type II secretory pathway pseudopilin PulG